MSNTILNEDRELKIEELEVASGGGHTIIETRTPTGTLVVVCSPCGVSAVWIPK